MIRNIDKLGRVCIPKEWRNLLDLSEEEKVFLDLDLDRKQILIKKTVNPLECPFCGDKNPLDLVFFKNGQMCINCKKELEKSKE